MMLMMMMMMTTMMMMIMMIMTMMMMMTLMLLLFHCRQSPSGNEFIENTKHKVWLKIPLDDLEIMHGKL